MHMHLNCKTNFNFYHVYISYGQTIFSDGEIYSSPYLQKQTVNLIFWERDIKVLCIGGVQSEERSLQKTCDWSQGLSVLKVES